MAYIRHHLEVGDRFGRLTVTGKTAPVDSKGRRKTECQCDCGRTTAVWATALVRGNTRSCGCLRKEMSATRFRAVTWKLKHGESGSPEYAAWRWMRIRCRPDYAQAKYYFDRGIRVCSEWDSDFNVFLREVGRKPSPKHTLDRIDNNRGYEPGNVRWATRKEQIWNSRRIRLVAHDGVEFPLMEWARRSGVDYATLRYRLKRGWPMERALLR